MMDTRELETAISAAGLAGAVTLITGRDGTRHSHVQGMRDLASGAPMAIDSLFQIASMTKAIVSVAALQCVEQGLLSLHAPIGDVLPDLDALQVLDGFDSAGKPIFRPANRRITLHHLLTHTSGLGYTFANAELLCALDPEAHPPGSMDSLRLPLLFDPGERWEYGVGIDWAGLAVETVTGKRLDAYVADAITAPLSMSDTRFFPDSVQRARAVTLYARTDAGIEPRNFEIGGGEQAEFVSGGGGLWSTAPDYARFLRMVMNGGMLDGARILQPDTVASLFVNQIGNLRAGQMSTAMPELALPYEQFPDQHCNWSHAFLINPNTGPHGRAGGSLCWAGIANCYYWIDSTHDVAGIFLTQLLPFADPGAGEAFAAFERLAYS